MTTIAIIGLGSMGKGLAKRLAGKTDLLLGSRNSDAAKAFAATLDGTAEVLDQAKAAARADIVVLALPYGPALEFARDTDLAGKILVDITNPLKPDYSGLTIGHTTSAAEELQAAIAQRDIVTHQQQGGVPVVDEDGHLVGIIRGRRPSRKPAAARRSGCRR